MTWPGILIVAYCIGVAAASALGGSLPVLLRLTHTRMQLIMSLVGGLMLGVALLHLLPHSIVACGSVDMAVRSAVIGLLVMFAMIRVLHVHQHSHDQAVDDETHSEHHQHGHAEEHEHGVGHENDHSHSHKHDHEHEHEHSTGDVLAHRRSWIGLFFGLAIHTLIDGIALAASVAAGALEDDTGLIGLATFLAILLHKPLDALSITSLMQAANWQRRWITVVNIAFSLMCPLGALAFYFGVRGAGPLQGTIVGVALGLSAGVFLCISLADLLPEVQFHHHDQGKLSGALLAGVLIAWGIGYLEPEHAHSPDARQHGADDAVMHDEHDHPHDDHDD